jgi:OmpA-OmpF porin, OOP family
MKSVLVLLGLFILLHTSTFAQSIDAKHGISYKILWIDHHSPDKNWLNGDFADTDLHTVGAELTYSRRLSKAFNLAIPVKLGVVDLNKDSAFSGNDKGWFSTDALLHLKMFDKPRVINPYLMGGIGLTWLDFDQLNPQLPVGMGLNIRLAPNFFLNTQVEYRTALDKGLDNFHYGAGLNIHIGSSNPKVLDSDGDGIPDLEDDCPLEAGLPAFNGCPDSDGDGIADKDDACPNEPGPASTMGCPDADGDGIPDKDDACPNEAGPASTMGCPDADGDGIADKDDACPNEPGSAVTLGCPDSDLDGVPDKDDRCPQVAGPANLKGCPDRDNDGVADIDDKCPDQPGPISNQGCPELKEAEKAIIKLAIQNVSFTSSTAELTMASKGILDQLADVLRNNPAYSCDISGHTDATGGAELNMELSKKRAKSCYDYLVLQGIDEKRLSHQGYGLTRPVGDNKTAGGRKANRRVEFDLSVK